MVSTNGLTINQHFCSGELIEAALFSKAKKCEHEARTCCENKAAKNNLKNCGLNKTKKCCDEKVVMVKVDDEAQPLFADYQQIVPTFFAIIPIQYLRLQSNLEFPLPQYCNYKPPLIVEEDMEVLIQSFLC